MPQDNQSLKQKVVKGAVWASFEKLGTQIVGFVVGMVLARLLTPTDYGTVALTGIFFAIANSLVDSGFGQALIQKKDADDLDFNSVFYLALGLSLIVYFALFFSAPYIASFYNTPVLTSIVRVSATCVLFHSINSVQNAELNKKMLFHLSFKVSVLTCLTSAVVGVVMAALGFGVWALVISSLASACVGVVARWFIIAWRPKLMFSFQRLKGLFSYGWKMAFSGLLDRFFGQLSGLMIGRLYTPADLAYVNRGQTIPSLSMDVIDSTLGRVTFPALVQLQDNCDKLRDGLRRMVQCSTFIVFPMMVGVALCAEPLIWLIFGKQWLFAVPYMQIGCFSFAIYPFHTMNLRAVQALGRSDIFLRQEILKKVLGLVCLLVSIRFGVMAFVMASAFAMGPISLVINSWPNRRLINYTIIMQITDVMPTIGACAVMCLPVVGIGYVADWLASFVQLHDSIVSLHCFLIAKVVCQALIGAATFFVLAYIFKMRPMREYAIILSAWIRTKWPSLASALERRFL